MTREPEQVPMISVRGLTKQYGSVLAVDEVTFDVEPGRVTGFLGPNGAGKSTTMRMIMGLNKPTEGVALIAGRPYAELSEPLRVIGALLDAGAMHPGRSGRHHLSIGARSNGIPLTRVDEVIDQIGLGPAARRRIKGYSLGMRQRLGIGAALLGDPQVLLFDEPVNGLDLDGVRWMRGLFRTLAAEGRTVLVSSHLMSEMQLIADRVIIIGGGRVLADSSLEEMLDSLGQQRVRIRTNAPNDLVEALSTRGVSATRLGPDEVEAEGRSAEEIGAIAHAVGAPIHHLAEVQQSLEDAYVRLTEDSLEYRGGLTSPGGEVPEVSGR